MSATPPVDLTDLPDTPDKAAKGTFNARVVALFDMLKNTSISEWRAMMANAYANAVEACNQAVAAAASAVAAALSASSAAGSASAAANTLAAAQAALGASKWAAGTNYTAGACAWSPTNGQLYRARVAITPSTIDPLNDPTNWYSLGLQSLPIAQVTDTGGSMYGAANGGLNTINEITHAGQCIKQLPQSPVNGDVCVVVVGNGRSDNRIAVNATSPISIAVGTVTVNDYVVLDTPQPVTFRYFGVSNLWRAM